VSCLFSLYIRDTDYVKRRGQQLGDLVGVLAGVLAGLVVAIVKVSQILET